VPDLMSWRTLIVLVWGIFNSAWLCWVFVTLFIYGSMVVPEPSRWIASFEVVLTAGLAILGIERLINIREKK
jgi:hypothetical protein